MATSLQSVLRRLECKDLLSYLKSLPKHIILQLYHHPAACAAVFRELPENAKLFILRVLFLEQPVTLAVALAWINNQHSSERTAVMEALTEMYIVEDTTQSSAPVFKLQEDFKRNFKITVAGGGEPWLGVTMVERDKHPKDVAYLDQYARERWECILHFMVRSEDKEPVYSRDIADVLLHAGFIKMESNKTDHKITALGFQFLLLDVSKQVWIFMLKCLEIVEAKGMDFVECLLLLFKLNFLTLGKDYSTEKFSDKLLKFVQQLREFGLVYQRTRKSNKFYPTRLASNLTTRTCEQMKLDSKNEGGIIVDSDYHITAYTSSALMSNLLDIFTVLIFKVEGATVSKITRKSCMKAFDMGITAEQIIKFLKAHAHKITANTDQIIPPAIADQLQLWEVEVNRINVADGALYNEFNSLSDFEYVRDYARGKQLLLLIMRLSRTWMSTCLVITTSSEGDKLLLLRTAC